MRKVTLSSTVRSAAGKGRETTLRTMCCQQDGWLKLKIGLFQRPLIFTPGFLPYRGRDMTGV